jgi:hypothetical protein
LAGKGGDGMSRRADDLRAMARRFGEVEEGPAHAPVAASAVRTRRVRRTVDLSPVDHRRLSQWCEDAAEELGLARVTSQDVFVALVTELLADEALSGAIRRSVKAVADERAGRPPA